MYTSIFEKVINESEVSLSITIPLGDSVQDLMDELNNDYAEGNKFFEHIGSSKSGGKRVVTVVYYPKGNVKSWANRVTKSLEKDSGYEVDCAIN